MYKISYRKRKMEVITKNNYHIQIYDSERKTLHNLNGPALIYIHPIKMRALYGKLHYYIYGKCIGINLSNKEFERLKNIELKKRVFE